MTQGFREKLRSQAIVRVLEFLKREGRATAPEIQAAMPFPIPQGLGLKTLLPELERTGLVARQQEPTPGEGQAKPYSITPDGERYLEETRSRAPGPDGEGVKERGWVAQEREPGPELQRVIMDVLIAKHEFKGNELRIRGIAREIAEAVQRTSERPR